MGVDPRLPGPALLHPDSQHVIDVIHSSISSNKPPDIPLSISQLISSSHPLPLNISRPICRYFSEHRLSFCSPPLFLIRYHIPKRKESTSADRGRTLPATKYLRTSSSDPKNRHHDVSSGLGHPRSWLLRQRCPRRRLHRRYDSPGTPLALLRPPLTNGSRCYHHRDPRSWLDYF